MAKKPERDRRLAGDNFLTQARQRLESIPWPTQNPATLFRDMALLVFETMREFFQRGAVARAAALTYTTLLSLIPLLGLLVVVFKQVGGFPWLMEKLQPLLAEYMSLDGSEMVSTFLLDRVAELDLATLGLFGVVTLGLGVYSLISTIETDFNNIWRVRRSRSIRQRLSSYWLLMTLLPVFAGVSMFLTGEAAVSRIFDVLPAWVNQARGHFLPMAVQFFGFLFLYWAVPNTRVRLVPAAIGAAFTAVTWEFAKLGFAFYTVRATNYSVLYGSLAALPLFMIWVYLTWVLILTGAELSFIIQNRRALLLKQAYKRMGPLPEYTIALAVREAVLTHFEAGSDLSIGDLSRLLCLPEAEINAVVETMVESGLFRRSQEGEKQLVMPARPREHLEAALVAGLFLKDPAEFVDLVESPFLKETLRELASRHEDMLKAISRGGDARQEGEVRT